MKAPVAQPGAVHEPAGIVAGLFAASPYSTEQGGMVVSRADKILADLPVRPVLILAAALGLSAGRLFGPCSASAAPTLCQEHAPWAPQSPQPLSPAESSIDRPVSPPQASQGGAQQNPEVVDELSRLRRRSGSAVREALQSLFPGEDIDALFREELQGLLASGAQRSGEGSPQNQPCGQPGESCGNPRSDTDSGSLTGNPLAPQVWSPAWPFFLQPQLQPQPQPQPIPGQPAFGPVLMASGSTPLQVQSPPLPLPESFRGAIAPAHWSPESPDPGYSASRAELVHRLRQVARQLDAIAADLEDLGLFAESDQIREQAGAIRAKGREPSRSRAQSIAR